jgi:hypothetical protein
MPEHPAPPALPEFTRSLRAFASVGSLATPQHDLVFAPLLNARKAAAKVHGADGRLAAFDASRIRRALRDAIGALAAQKFPKADADRRALSAELGEFALPAFSALDLVAQTAAGWHAATDADRDAKWGAWVDAVQALFNGVDAFWNAARRLVVVTPPASPKSAKRSAARLAAFIALGLGAAAAPVRAQHVTLRVPGVRPESLLKHGFDVVGADRGTPLVVASPDERARMELLGFHGTPMPAAPGTLAGRIISPAQQAIAVTKVYRDYDDPVRGIRALIDSLARTNSRISVDTLGKSYEGRPMLAVKVGPKGDSPSRPNVIIMATYHAREWAATEIALRLILYLANPPAGNARVDSLLQTRDIWIIPVANPDGFEYTFTGDRLWRKTRSPQGSAVGVDMNRNHRTNWGFDDSGSSPDPASDIYRGPAPASEIETRNIEAFHALHPPAVAISYHTYAGLLLYPPGAIYGQLSSDLPVYQTLAGTNNRSAVSDHLLGSARTFYSPGNAWTLYTTNGEYNDWAGAQYGTIGFTTEATSGYLNGAYYGFEFPDDDSQLQQLFQDNLPFALDVIESARDPYGYVSSTTGGHADHIMLESVSPEVIVTVPAAAAPSATIGVPALRSFRIDSTDGGRFTRRLTTTQGSRPSSVTVGAGGVTTTFTVLAINGAESGETGWTATQFRTDSTTFEAGRVSWHSDGGGDLRSPAIKMPTDADTVSLLFWNQYNGSGYTETPFGRVLMSSDGGATFQQILRVQGAAPVWYTERVAVGGVKGKSLVFDFSSSGLPWNLDEITVVSHGASTAAPGTAALALRPSENPVHKSVVYFTWPFATPAGDMQAFDFSGRLVWRTAVAAGGTIAWDLNSARLPNGVYVVVARSGGQTLRLKLFVVRNGS